MRVINQYRLKMRCLSVFPQLWKKKLKEKEIENENKPSAAGRTDKGSARN